MRYLVKNITNKFHVPTRKTSPTPLKQGRAEKRKHHTHPWIYGSRVGAWLGPFSVRNRLQQMGAEAKARATEEDRVNTTTCMPGSYDKKIFIDDEKATLIPTKVSRDIQGG